MKEKEELVSEELISSDMKCMPEGYINSDRSIPATTCTNCAAYISFPGFDKSCVCEDCGEKVIACSEQEYRDFIKKWNKVKENKK